MYRSRLLWKLYAGYVGLLVLLTAIVGLVVPQRLERDALQETRSALEAKAVLLRGIVAPALESSGEADLQPRLRRLGSAIGTRLTVIRRDGTVVADSEEDAFRMDNHADRPEIQAARAHGIGEATRWSQTLGAQVMYLAFPVRQHDELSGYVRTAVPLTAVVARLAYLRTMIAVGAGGAAVVGFGLSFVLVQRVMRPLTSLTAMAESIAAGPYDQVVRTRAPGEIATLARAFNRMAYHLRERMTTITREHSQLLAILGSMVEGVVAVNHEERVIHMNEAAGTILHVVPQESLGRRLWEVTRVRAVVDTVASTLREAHETSSEARMVVESRDQVVNIHASPWWNDTGETAGAVVVLHDVTELRHLENVRRDFVANVSHELKTPITTIQGFVETLQDGALDDRDQAKHFLAIIARHVERLKAIIEDLLSLSRLEQGPEAAELSRTETKLADVLQAAIQVCMPTAAPREVTIISSCEATLRVRISAPLLEQALVNLLDNAIHCSKPGRRVWLEATQGGSEVAICVRDQGTGIPQEHVPRLFERFYRVDTWRSRDHGGTGLGLAIVKHIAQAHGGRVSVESTVGLGSTFTLHLPTD
ncbi:Alkaline phosphatase synthesis sensor protein PhoR [Candidatus Entotheonellaceae bacterium PAL068K]